jgi:hypothetical protein
LEQETLGLQGVVGAAYVADEAAAAEVELEGGRVELETAETVAPNGSLRA